MVYIIVYIAAWYYDSDVTFKKVNFIGHNFYADFIRNITYCSRFNSTTFEKSLHHFHYMKLKTTFISKDYNVSVNAYVCMVKTKFYQHDKSRNYARIVFQIAKRS